MLSQLTIPKKKPVTAIDETTAPVDHEQLLAIGLQHVERLARRVWNDYNVHDPGITTLELLAYAITDLSYRASFPIKDLLASQTNNAQQMSEQFFTARQIFPNRALTVNDYRKILIDIVGVKNAWIKPVSLTYYADTINGVLLNSPPNQPGIIPVNVRGLYQPVIEYADDVDTQPEIDDVNLRVTQLLEANRNLCEDFVDLAEIAVEEFVLCAELEISPDADLVEVHAQILYQVDEYLSPEVRMYTLSEMLEKTTADGTLYTAEKIFDGPELTHGFIADEELAASDLRTEIRLSDIISIIMDVEGVLAVRDIKFNPSGATDSLANKWVIPVEEGKQALLDRDNWRLVSYKRAMPFTPDKTDVLNRWNALESTNAKVANNDDFAIPLGTFRDLDEYYSFQNHYPAVYGLGPAGLPSGADTTREAQVRQLKGYLLFFDQLMSGYFAQLNHVRDLFSTDSTIERTYFYQVVNSFIEYDEIYGVAEGSVVSTIESNVEDPDVLVERRNRFLDHMIARFAERFNDFAHIMADQFGTTPSAIVDYKCAFLANYPATSSGRSMAFDYTVIPYWDSTNISGLEARLCALLGIADSTRRNLGDDPDAEGMYLIENILIRPDWIPPDDPLAPPDPFLPICPDPNCKECSDEDPYSYRIHIILPAYGPRFGDIDFRIWAEGVIREEVPAHILPKICWIDQDTMQGLQGSYEAWLEFLSGFSQVLRNDRLNSFITALFAAKNIYPAEYLRRCNDPHSRPQFILGRAALGTQPPP